MGANSDSLAALAIALPCSIGTLVSESPCTTSIGIFISGFKLFISYKEDPLPTSDTKRIIKTGIFAYTRNPIYLAFILFHLCMFLVFENVLYFISSVGLSIWLHNWIVPEEETYLRKNFNNEYDSYMNNVNRWIFF